MSRFKIAILVIDVMFAYVLFDFFFVKPEPPVKMPVTIYVPRIGEEVTDWVWLKETQFSILEACNPNYNVNASKELEDLSGNYFAVSKKQLERWCHGY